jgi:hypothetical protein
MAGHLLFIDKDPAKSVEIFAGMDGSSGSVESRHGIYAVVPRRWYANALKENDVGFIHIDEAFNAVAPMKIGKTPAIGKGTVYGYPGDMPDYGKGKHLCKSTSLMKYEPHETAGMVEHNADTEKGELQWNCMLDCSDLLMMLQETPEAQSWMTTGSCAPFIEAGAINPMAKRSTMRSPLIARAMTSPCLLQSLTTWSRMSGSILMATVIQSDMMISWP